MRDFFSDFRYALRSLFKNPGFTAIAVLALALGIGANTAIFSVVNAVLLRPLPFDHPERLMSIASRDTRRPAADNASYPDFQDFRARNHTFEYMSAFQDTSWALTGPGREAVNLNVAVVNADLIPMLGVRPLLGRAFRKDEDENTGLPSTVLLSHGVWRKQFGSDPAIVNRTITLRGQPYIVIGVMPPGFNFPVRNEPFSAWTTFAFSSDLASATGEPLGVNRGAHFLNLFGKLKPGITPAAGRADLAVIAAALAKAYPKSNKYRAVEVQSLIDQIVAHLRPVLLILLGAVGCVLLVACANVANLLLARASSRHRELAIRAALGAGRFRVARQVLTESLALSLLGGGAGLLLGVWGNELLIRFSPADVPRLGDAGIDIPVFLFALAASLVTGAIFGLLPAVRAAQADPAEALKEGSRGTTEGIRSNKARSVLVVSEVALALLLLSSAGLLIRSLDRLNHVQPGFRASRVLTADLTLPETRYKDEKINPFLDQLEMRLQQHPGIESAADVTVLPLSGNDMSTGVQIEGHPVPAAERRSTRINLASPSYFRAMGIPLRSGRFFNASDTEKSPNVAVVSETFAREFFPGRSPLGKRVSPGFSHGKGEPPFREIVGVVGDVQQDRIGQTPLPEVFYPRAQFPNNYNALVIRTRDDMGNDARSAIAVLRSTLRQMDPDLPLDNIHTMDERVGESLAQPRFQSFLLVIFAAIALVLTAVGLYGVISYSVAQRTHEIGTRMALGARQQNILRLVLGQGLALTLGGVVIGVAGALAVSRLLTSLLFEVAPSDPLTLCAVSVLVFVVSILAIIVPALRASHVDPMTALRYE